MLLGQKFYNNFQKSSFVYWVLGQPFPYNWDRVTCTTKYRDVTWRPWRLFHTPMSMSTSCTASSSTWMHQCVRENFNLFLFRPLDLRISFSLCFRIFSCTFGNFCPSRSRVHRVYHKLLRQTRVRVTLLYTSKIYPNGNVYSSNRDRAEGMILAKIDDKRWLCQSSLSKLKHVFLIQR